MIKKALHHSYRGIVALMILGLIGLLAFIGVAKLFDISAQMKATPQVQVAKIDGATTSTIVWPDGASQTTAVEEVVTPKSSYYQSGGFTHNSKIDCISFNPLDSAAKATEKMEPAKFEEGPKPAIKLNPDDGVDTTATKDGAKFTGLGGWQPSIWDAMPWIAVILCFLVVLPIGKKLWAWVTTTIPAVIPQVGTIMNPQQK